MSARALSLIPSLKNFIAGVVADRKRPTSNSFETMESALTYVLLPAKIAFFQRVALILEQFLTAYQTDSPMMPFMYSDVKNMMLELISIVVKPTVVAGKTGMNLYKIDLSESAGNLLDASVVELGFAVLEQITRCRSQLSKRDLLQFRTECRTFLIKVIEKLQNKSPLEHKMVKGASCLDPSVMSSETLRNSRVKIALDEFVKNKWVSGLTADGIMKEYKAFCFQVARSGNFKEYKRTERLDAFLFNLLSKNEASEDFCLFVSRILCLSHGQASVERGFNINKEILVENQRERSLIAQRIVHDTVFSSVGKNWYEFKVTKPLLESVRQANRRLKEARQSELLRQKKGESLANEKRIAAAQLKAKELERKNKRDQLEEEISLMDEEIKDLNKKLKQY